MDRISERTRCSRASKHKFKWPISDGDAWTFYVNSKCSVASLFITEANSFLHMQLSISQTILNTRAHNSTHWPSAGPCVCRTPTTWAYGASRAWRRRPGTSSRPRGRVGWAGSTCGAAWGGGRGEPTARRRASACRTAEGCPRRPWGAPSRPCRGATCEATCLWDKGGGRSVIQSDKRSIYWSFNQLLNQLINKSTDQSSNQFINHQIN